MLRNYSDSTKTKNTIKWLNLREWNNYHHSELSLKYFNKNDALAKNRYHPSNVMPKDPFKLDYRRSSYYVPPMVRDELNLIMNRPKESAFVPVLGVAFIAAQLAAKYIFVKDKLKISTENVLNTVDYYDILKELWKKNPQSASQLYENTSLKKIHTLNTLLIKIQLLIDNKLIKQKNIEDEEMLFFPAISKTEHQKLLEKSLSEVSITESDKNKIQKIINK